MIRNLLFAIFFLASICSQAQIDSVFFIGKSTPTLGNAVINYKKQIVSVFSSDKKFAESSFDDISSIKSSNGKSYTQQKINGSPQLLIVLIEGKYGLLYDEQNKLFFILKDNSLKIISRDHIKRALPLIFGDKLMDQFYLTSHKQVDYSFKYLKKLVTFSNQNDDSLQIINQQNFNHFKTSIYIGPYSAVGISRTAFDLVDDYIKTGRYETFKTAYYKGSSASFGLHSKIVFGTKISADIIVYWNKSVTNNILRDSTGIYRIEGAPRFTMPERFDTNVKLAGYYYKTINFDLSVNYSLAKKTTNKFRPYLFAGPSVAIMKENEVKLSARFFNNDVIKESYISRWYQAKADDYMIGLNLGFGVDYQIKKRIVLNLFGKYQGGRIPKIRTKPLMVKEQNNTPMPSGNFGGLASLFDARYGQYSQVFSIGGSILFKL